MVPGPPVIAPFQFPGTLVEGNRAQVSCSLISGDLPISISWRKDGGPLPRDPAVNSQQMEFFSHLTFSDLRARHTGRYTCIATNAAATANYSADLVVRGDRTAPRTTDTCEMKSVQRNTITSVTNLA